MAKLLQLVSGNWQLALLCINWRYYVHYVTNWQLATGNWQLAE
jgi:hypothetical protein